MAEPKKKDKRLYSTPASDMSHKAGSDYRPAKPVPPQIVRRLTAAGRIAGPNPRGAFHAARPHEAGGQRGPMPTNKTRIQASKAKIDQTAAIMKRADAMPLPQITQALKKIVAAQSPPLKTTNVTGSKTPPARKK